MSATTTALGAAGGKALAGLFGALTAVRRGKPLHPRGVVVAATVERTGAGLGVPWLDKTGTEEVTVRLSRSIGLPAGWPDVLGLSVRFGGAEHHDLLLGSSGWSTVTRHVPVPAADTLRAPFTTVFPFDSAAGRVVVGARAEAAEGPPVFGLWAARVGQEWRRFATLRLHADPARSEDAAITLDPVLNAPPGLQLPRGLAALREPAYAVARRVRRSPAA